MLKLLGGFAAGVLAVAVLAYVYMGSLMFWEVESPFGVEETVARIQHNVQKVGNGWALSGLRNPGKAVESAGGNVLPVMMVEACSTQYSGPILKDDSVRFLSILMPCKVSVYKKNDGKTYIGMMNAGLMGKMFGPLVGDIMSKVAEDQKKFIEFDPSQPAPPMIKPAPQGASGGAGASAPGGC
ncbi:MAG: DUF302 domain-containing protein [Gammaproteobacteria bacterium]|nr:DUF302 domain-containing protein [Gammaproteobacteria bacterium]MDD2928204.1 DUF302 domain-containing protein [Sideroxydans sp.]MDD5470544.1 DUF302 domain-containing protein [Sideroxydans sp.]